MSQKFQWFTTVIIAALLLAGVDGVVERRYGGPPSVESDYRFSEELRSSEFDRQVQAIEGYQGLRVVFLGDSIVRGAAVPEGEQTIPAQLERLIQADPELRNAGFRVFNFGIAGGRDADKYGALKTLLDRQVADYVIMNISYPFYSKEILKTPVQFPHVYLDAYSPQEKQELNIAGVTKPRPEETPAEPGAVKEERTFETILMEDWLSHWKLYKYRQEINQDLFGGHPVQAAKEKLESSLGKPLAAKVEPPKEGEDQTTENPVAIAPKDRPENLYKVYDQFPWNPPEVEHLKQVFDVAPLDEGNLGYRYLQKTVALTKERQVPAFFFLSPVNTALLDQFGLLNRSHWQDNTVRLKRVMEQGQVPVVDLQQAVEARWFHDSLHLLEEGNRQVAQELFRQLKPELLKMAGGQGR